MVLQKCKETNLMLNLEKCHLMVEEEIVLGHKISLKRIKGDKAKAYVIDKLSPPTNVKCIRSLLGHARFYKRFIQNFSLITKPLCILLLKDAPFVFTNECM